MPRSPSDQQPRVVPVVTTRHLPVGLLVCVVLGLSLFVLRTYQRVYDPRYGWSELILFGSNFANKELPRLQRVPHYLSSVPGEEYGYDGQFYAQMAIDPSLRDPAFDHALDLPAYRGRRIGLPALAFGLGGGKPRRIVQVYALANLVFWFLLLASLLILLRPRTVRPLLCLSAAMLSFGVITSMERALIDLPAAAMIFAGAVLGSWGRYGAFAAAVLTRETSALAAVGFLDVRLPWRTMAWKRSLGMLAVAGGPFAGWMIYVIHRFRGGPDAVGSQNFAWPMQAMCARFVAAIAECAHHGLDTSFITFKWLYKNEAPHEWLTIAAIFFQGLFFLVRRDVHSPFWRTGLCYLALGSVLGGLVWDETAAAARVLLPMTLCFYVLLARERGAWFWPFYLLGGLSIPFGVHLFWTLS